MAVFRLTVITGLDVVSQSDSRFYAFYNPRDLRTLKNAVMQLENYIIAEGPFDAIMAFSAGTVVSAAYLLKHSLQQTRGHTGPIRAAVFLSSATSTAEFEYLGLRPGNISINVPTAHIWGSHDGIAPTGGHDMATMCSPEKCFTFIHGGGHEVPKKEALTGAVHTIRRMLQIVDQD